MNEKAMQMDYCTTMKDICIVWQKKSHTKHKNSISCPSIHFHKHISCKNKKVFLLVFLLIVKREDFLACKNTIINSFREHILICCRCVVTLFLRTVLFSWTKKKGNDKVFSIFCEHSAQKRIKFAHN